MTTEKTKKTYSERWTIEEERKLIQTRILFDSDFQSTHTIPRLCWEKVTKEAGLSKTIKNVTQNWQNLLKKYKKMIQPQSGVSTENGEILPTQWELFDELHDFLKSKHGLHPIYLIDAEVNNDDFAGPSNSSASSTATSFSCVRNVSPFDVFDSSDENVEIHSTPAKKPRRGRATEVLIDHLTETAVDAQKSIRNIEKIMKFITKKMFPDGDFPELE